MTYEFPNILSPSAELTDVPQIEEDTPAQGGPGGPDNAQAQALLNRIEYLLTVLLPPLARMVQGAEGAVLADAAGAPVDLDNSPTPATAVSLGDTLGQALSALADGLRLVKGTANQIDVAFDNVERSMTLSLPQDIAPTSSPQFDTLRASKLRGNNAPTIALGTGAGDATAAVNLIYGTDLAFRVDITTGAAPTAGQTIFEATFAEAYDALKPPIVFLVPHNRRAWDQQNTANKAVAVDLASTTGAKLVVQAGTTALQANTAYSWVVFTAVRP